jgi:SRSO17 transposase
MAPTTDSSEIRFERYVEEIADTVAHADRRKPLEAYLTGLLLPGERKSVEPMAALIDPRHVCARHQSMHHFVANSEWDDAAVIRIARTHVLDAMERHGAAAGWIIDDTGFPKKGGHSVGVARQYCGVLGKQDNCQVAVSLSIANEAVSVPAAYRLYLPELWAKDPKRRKAAGVPKTVQFQTKWQIALDMIDSVRADELPPAPVLADAGYGNVTAFRDALSGRLIPYVVGTGGETTVWPPGIEPLLPKHRSGRGQPPSRIRRSPSRQPAAVLDLAKHAPEDQWQDVCWREGTRGKMTSRFLFLRVRPAHRDEKRHEPRDFEWLMAEWPKDETEPTKFWLSTMPSDTAPDQLIRLAKLRWRIERDYQELKGSFGLDHYEGRGWRGFHHHGTLCIAAYAFLAAERARLSPPEPLAFLRAAGLPRGFKPRGSASAA